MTTGGELGTQVPRAVSRISEHCDRTGLAGEQLDPGRGVTAAGAAGLGQRAVSDDPGVGLDSDVGFEAVLAAVHRLMGVAGIRIDGARSP